jgi:hypothetical protein
MNKFKKACEELSCYLNKDSRGIELLSRVTRIGNEVRNELAASDEARKRAEINCQNQLEIAAKAVSELKKMSAEKQQCLDTIASLRCKVAEFEKRQVKDHDHESVSETLELTPKEVSRLLRDALDDKLHLKRNIVRASPGLVDSEAVLDIMSGRKIDDVIVLKDSVSNLSYTEMAKLGRLVAVYAIMTGHALVTSQHFGSIYNGDTPESETVETTNRLFCKFMKPRCDFSEEFRSRAVAVGSDAQPFGKSNGGWCKNDALPLEEARNETFV